MFTSIGHGIYEILQLIMHRTVVERAKWTAMLTGAQSMQDILHIHDIFITVANKPEKQE